MKERGFDEYAPCKICGSSHGMGIEKMETGEITHIDVCKDCSFRPISSVRSGFETGVSRDERFLINKIKSELMNKLEKCPENE
jgi:hypothetical protein